MSVTYRFGSFEIDADRRELRRGDAPVDVQPKVLDVIVHLVRERDRVVSREELLDALWGDTAVSEGVLTTAVHAARSALDDSASRGWAIKTVARRGYRFAAPVVEGRGPASGSAATIAAPPTLESWEGDVFVGRDRWLARIESAFRASAAGRGRILVVSGESGVGKTRLLDEVMVRGGGWGATVATAWCEAREGAPPYAPWIELLRRLVDTFDPAEAARELGADATDLATLLPGVHDLVAAVPEPQRLHSNTSRFRLMESIRTYLARCASRRPLLLMLDDLQAADHASLRLLTHLARELRHLPVLMLVALREPAAVADPVVEETLAEVARQFPGERMQLEGLSGEDVELLVAKLTGVEPPAEWVSLILARSEGNPFFVREIVSLLDSQAGGTKPTEDVAAWATRIPPGVRDVILGRLHRLSEPCQHALAAAAVLGREFRIGVLAHLLERDPADAVAEAAAAGLLREDPADADLHRFSHGLIRETLYDTATSAQRRRLHRRAGEALEELAVLPSDSLSGELARHFMRAGDDEALAKASRYAAQAAERASAMNAHDEAAKLYGTALDSIERMSQPDEALRCDLLIALGAARLDARTGDPRGRESLLRAARLAQQLDEPDQLARAALAVSATALQSGPRDPEITRALESALEAVGDHGDDVMRSRLMANLAYQLRLSDEFDRSMSLCEEALGLAGKSGDDGAVAEALNMRCALLSGPGHAAARMRDADELLARAERAGATELGLFGHRWRLLTMLELGDVEAADRELAAHDAAVDQGRVWSGRWYGLTLRGARALAEARFGAAERMVVEGFAHRRDETTPLVIGVFATQLFWLRRQQGRLAEVEHLRRHQSTHLVFRVLKTLLEAELGYEDAARESLHAVVESELDDLGFDFSNLYIQSMLAESAVVLGDEECAQQLYQRLLPHAEQYVLLFLGSLQLGSLSRYLGRLAATIGEPALAGYHYAHALDANQRSGAHLWVAHTRLDWATALASQGPACVDEARELLRPCLAEAHERDMAVLARQAAELMDRLPGRGSEPRPGAGLRPRSSAGLRTY